MNKKVIVPVNTTTDWCSPAFFVPKADMIRVRLVTDYTHLNKYVKRPVHPFPYTSEILQVIPSTAKCFAKLDVAAAAGSGTKKFVHNDISPPLRQILLPQSTHGSKHIIG